MQLTFKLFLILAILHISVLSPTVYGLNNEKIKFTHITTEDGLSHHEVLYVVQDTSGFMWFGTKNGLNKYDGMSIRSYFHGHDSTKSNSLTGNFAHWIHEDQSGVLWIATWGDGISAYDPKNDTFTNYYHQENNPQSISSNNVWSLFVDSHGFVWAATDNGLSKLEPEKKTFSHYQHDPQNPNSLSNNTISRIREDDKGIFWVSTYGGGLNRFDPKTGIFTHYKHNPNNPHSISNDNLWGVYIDSKNNIWIASEKGLNRFEQATETFVSYQHDENDPNSLSSDTVTFIHEDHSGMLWLGTFGGGLNHFDPKKETFVHYRHDSQDSYSLSNDIIMSIYEDSTGALWVATYGGVDKYDPGEYQFEYYRNDFNNPNDLNNSVVRSFYQEKSGTIWIGTGGGGLNRLNKDRNHFDYYLHDENDKSSISDNDVWAIDQDKRGDLWVGTHGAGLNRLIPGQNKFVRYEHDPNNLNTPACDPLYDLIVDKKRDVVWIAAYLSGLDKFDIVSETFTHYRYDPNNPDGIVSNWSTAVFSDSKGLVWIGTEAGLSLFDPETERFTNFKHDRNDEKSISSNMIQAIYEDSHNIIWVGTSDGLNRYEQETSSFYRFAEKDGLVGNHVAAILEDNEGNLWISTDKGLSKFDPKNKTFRNYNQLDGLQGNRFLMHSSHKNKSGELFFGGVNGFNIFHPNELHDNTHLPKIVFTNFKIFNQPVKIGVDSALAQHINKAHKISLTYDQRIFSIEFVALNYRNSKKNQYAYKLDGFDQNYTYTDSSHRVVTYTNLNPGNYTFHVKGSNNDGVWNNETASINISIKPPWWRTVWFNVLIGLLILLIIFSVFNYIVKLNSEIKHRKKVQKELHESEIKYRSLFENMAQGAFYQNADGTLIDYNKAALEIFGLTADQFLGKTSLDPQWNVIKEDGSILPGENHPSMAALKTGRPIRDQILGVFNTNRKDYTWVVINANPQFKEGKSEPYQVFVTLHDITALKKAEDTLDNRENRYRTILYTAIDGFWITDIKGNFLEVNEAYCQMSGYSENELLNMQISDVEANEDSQEIFLHLKTGIEKGHDRFESTHRRKDRSLYQVEVNFSYSDINGGQFIVFIKDITEKKQLQANLFQAQKMEAIGTLAGGIAHDFNNILGAILGYAEMVQEDCPTGSTMRNDINSVVEASHRAKELVKQILAFSRQAESEEIVLQPALIIKEAMKMLRASLPKTIDIQQEFDPEAGLILADPTQIHQIITNLCTNAFHAMEETGGTLNISLKSKELSLVDVVSEPHVQPGYFVEISVGDTGPGIAPEIMDKIFDPFFTTKEVGKGTGMGLAIIHGIAKKAGGFVSCKSTPGEGTTFHVYLPVHAETVPLKAETTPLQIIETGIERILFIDDEEMLAEMGKTMLERLGYRVTVKTSSIEALATIQSQAKDFDLVITDHTMPGMTGSDLARRILQIRPGMPIILCTGFSNMISEEKARIYGIKGFAMKPLAKKDLASLIRKVLDGE